MWRWVDQTSQTADYADDRTAVDEPERPALLPSDWKWIPYDDFIDDAAHWLEPLKDAQERRRGYCGLAGKPEITMSVKILDAD